MFYNLLTAYLCYDLFLGLLALVSYSVVSYTNGLVALNMINPLINSPPLPDIGFYYLPQISPYCPNIMLVLFCIYFAIKFFRIYNAKYLVQLLWCITILFTIRLFTFTVTTVPPSTTGCINPSIDSPIEWNVLKSLIVSNDNTCSDYMFSGHACYFVILLLFVMKLSRSVLEKILCSVYVLLGLTSIISGHIHYTNDVVVAIALSIWCFYLVTNRQIY